MISSIALYFLESFNAIKLLEGFHIFIYSQFYCLVCLFIGNKSDDDISRNSGRTLTEFLGDFEKYNSR